MAKVGIFTETPKRFFKFDSDTEVLIQFVDKDAMSKLVRQANEVAAKIKTPQGVAYDMFLGKKAVLGWRKIGDETHPGLTFPDGSPIHFTTENRNMMITKSREFSEFVYIKATSAAGFLGEDPEVATDEPGTIEKFLEDYEGEVEPGN